MPTTSSTIASQRGEGRKKLGSRTIDGRQSARAGSMRKDRTAAAAAAAVGGGAAASAAASHKSEAVEPVLSTRLCIKNLPKNFKESDLRAYIRETVTTSDDPVTITDCRILMSHPAGTTASKSSSISRRVAFVGFANAQQAAQTLQRLHSAYCQTAKLTVEYATAPSKKQIPQQQQLATSSSTAAASTNEQTTAKKSTPHQTTKKVVVIDQKKQEFLSVMGISTAEASSSTTNRKFWANDDIELQQQPSETANPKKAALAEIAEDDKSSSETTSPSSSSDSDDDDDDADPLLQLRNGDPHQAPQPQQSAMEFLRSKQVAEQDLEERRVNDDADDNDAVESSSDDDDDGDDNHDVGQDDEALLMKVARPEEGVEASETSLATDVIKTTALNDDDDVVDKDEASNGLARNRLFLRNLPFSATADDIIAHLQPYGTITECHVAMDDHQKSQSKGFAFVTFDTANAALAARSAADGHDFQGRLLHILPARKAPVTDSALDDTEDNKHRTYKEKMELKRKQEAAKNNQTGWLASFVRGDAVVDNLAVRLGLRKGDILSVKDGLSSGDAAVRLALGETAVIEENRTYFADHGIDMDSLVSLGGKEDDTSTARSQTAILVKNLPHDTTKDELKQVFQGDVTILLPPSRTIAVIEYNHANDAKLAFRRLAYRRFKSVPLYLEWAPLASKVATDAKRKRDNDDAEVTAEGVENEEEELVVGPTSTIYVKNLSFGTTEEQLQSFFANICADVRAVRIPQKVAPVKRRGDEMQVQSMGFGFVEFGSKESAQKVLKKLQGAMLDGHALELKPSTAGTQQISSTSSKLSKSVKPPSKLMVRNVPFQATRKELLQLFGSFGQLKKVRLPKKFDGSHRGFAFIEYLTGKDAASAMQVLSRTHLYGRHLVIEWAAEDEEVDDLQILREKADRDMAPKGKKTRFD